MQHSDLLAALLPPVSYPPQAPRLRAELNAEGRMFDALYSGVKSVTGAVTPFYAESLLPDWERVLGGDGRDTGHLPAAPVARAGETGRDRRSEHTVFYAPCHEHGIPHHH